MSLPRVRVGACVSHQVPFPCVVYTKKRKNASEYEFSHYTPAAVAKSFPASLRVADLQAHSLSTVHVIMMRKACFLVLVSGDTAQCVSATNTHEKRTQFLYSGSRYATPHSAGSTHALRTSEVHEDYVQLCFFSTLAAYAPGAAPSICDLGCGISLFPRTIHEKDIATLGKWVDHNIARSAAAGTWVETSGNLSYSEQTRAQRPNNKRPRGT